MKKSIFKAIVTVVLTTVIISASAVSAGAYDFNLPEDFVPWEYEPTTLDNEHTLAQKQMELYRYCDSLCTYFNCYPESGEFYEAIDGERALHHIDRDNVFTNAISDVLRGINNDLTDEEFLAYYDELRQASRNPQVTNSEILFLINICEKEDNRKSFYSEEVWEPFVKALNDAKEAYNRNTDNGTVYYSDQVEGNSKIYWDLYFAYNDLCLQVTKSGDVDGSGEADIVDVTYIQRSATGIGPRLNAAQRCAGCMQTYTAYGPKEAYPDIVDATLLQRKLTGLKTPILNNWTMSEIRSRWYNFKANHLIRYEYERSMFPGYYDD